jgi:hypothetical protein
MHRVEICRLALQKSKNRANGSQDWLADLFLVGWSAGHLCEPPPRAGIEV